MPEDKGKGKAWESPQVDSGDRKSDLADNVHTRYNTRAVRDRFPVLFPPDDAPLEDKRWAEKTRAGTTVDEPHSYQDAVLEGRRVASTENYLKERRLNDAGIGHVDFAYEKADKKRQKVLHPERPYSYEHLREGSNNYGERKGDADRRKGDGKGKYSS